ncbi:MAG: putative toxin-antitoxin system toxin component, PIN family [bacterium]
MIKIVPDTNVLIRATLGFRSPQRKLLHMAMTGDLVLYGSEETFKEFCDVISRDRFKDFFKRNIYSLDQVVLNYKQYIKMKELTPEIKSIKVPTKDPKDVVFFHIAKASGAKIIISEDKNHVLSVPRFDDIRTTDPENFLGCYNKIS